jgi:hypothetical protein
MRCSKQLQKKKNNRFTRFKFLVLLWSTEVYNNWEIMPELAQYCDVIMGIYRRKYIIGIN